MWFLQEVTPLTVSSLQAFTRTIDYDLVSPLQRGRTPVEGFDVCMLLRRSAFVQLRVGLVPLTNAQIRHMLYVQVQVKQNGAYLVLATLHFGWRLGQHSTEKQRTLSHLGYVGSFDSGWLHFRWRLQHAEQRTVAE